VNKLQRELRVISDERLDDTCTEMDACEQARLALDIVGEAREIIAAQERVIARRRCCWRLRQWAGTCWTTWRR